MSSGAKFLENSGKYKADRDGDASGGGGQG